eukprot:8240702-Prorocentrum_lima.AAC.1
MTGKESHVRVVLGPEPLIKAPPTDLPPCAHGDPRTSARNKQGNAVDASWHHYARFMTQVVINGFATE